ncbi:hypothetical protein ACHQM5_011928 [Ranunculus cassubicifolius]
MSSFLTKPSFKFFTQPHSSLKIQSLPNCSYNYNKNFKFCSKISASNQQSQPVEPQTSINEQSFKNPIWVFIPYLVQYVRNTAISGTKIGLGFLLRNWGSWVKGFSEESSKLLDEEILMNGGKNMKFLKSGGIGMTLLSVTSTAKLRISPFIATLAANPTFMSALIAWFSAQSMKVVLNFFVERRWDFRILCASGGMPSSHTALCTALTTSVALCHGVADSLFPVCLGFSLIVMYDAIGVRRHAGMQAEVLNMIIADLFQGHPISQRKLKELLGHTPSQVLAGAFLGIAVSCLWCQSNFVPT